MRTTTKFPELQAALKAAHLAAAVSRVADATGMDRTEITTPDGTRLDTFKFLDAMRARGYQVSEPRIPQTQTKAGHTAWKVDITVPAGASLQMVFFTPGVRQ